MLMVKVFRSGEMLYALMKGASWDNPIALHAVSLIWKFTRSMERGLSVVVDPISGREKTAVIKFVFLEH
ncbi:hypothetical protein KEJ34_06330 [Candidatus Bathyarchaeota archaeon]|nr:hypothetical protein [Candidatus Bathyarchaeota archaeon]